MVYELPCPNCMATSYVNPTDDCPVISWTCAGCGSDLVSSLPTTDGSALITDPAATGSLVSAGDVYEGQPITPGVPLDG